MCPDTQPDGQPLSMAPGLGLRRFLYFVEYTLSQVCVGLRITFTKNVMRFLYFVEYTLSQVCAELRISLTKNVMLGIFEEFIP